MIRRFTLITVMLLFLGTCCAVAQFPLTPEQRELVLVQIQKEKALVKYYEGQLELSKKEYQDNKPIHPKTIWEKYANRDPADIVESLGILIGIALILTVVVFSYRAAQRERADARLYDALNRFGGVLPAGRAAAAGALGQMGRRKEYFQTAFDQLVYGLTMEEHPAVRAAVGNAAAGLAAIYPQLAALTVQRADPETQKVLSSILGGAAPE